MKPDGNTKMKTFDKMIFNGQNILQGFPEGLAKVVDFLNEKATEGKFSFSDSLPYWEDNEFIIDPLGLQLDGDGYYFAVSLAYLASLREGHVVFPEGINEWRWAWSLNILAEYAEWLPSFMKNVIDSFPRRSNDVETLMNNAVHTYSRKGFDCGLELLKGLPQYTISIKAGLMENDFERYCTIFPPHDESEDFANVFLQAYQLSAEDTIKAFDIALEFSAFTSATAMSFFLKAHASLDDERKTVCEERVRAMLNGEDTSPYVTPVANWAFRLRKSTPFMEECVLSLVKGLGKENAAQLAAIDNAIAFNHEDPEFLAKLIVEVADNLNPIDISKMEHCLHFLSEKREVFQNLVLSFVLHPKGMYRIAGRRLWDEYHLETFDFNAEELDEPLQCLFVLSMLQDFGNPEKRLPKVLPLLNAKSEKVKSFLMNCMVPYVDEYMGHVTNAIDKLGIECEEAAIIKSYVDERANVIKARRSMKELSPVYTDEKVFREAMRQQREHMHEIMKEAEARHKPAWQDFMATVVLARGGGWREADGTNRHLPLTSFSMPSRIMAESMSPKEQDKWLNQLLKDWDDTAGDN